MTRFHWIGPYQFFSCGRSCPQCGQPLLTMTRLDWDFVRVSGRHLGLACHCVHCNTRYRAYGKRPGWIRFFMPGTEKLWWRKAKLEKILTYDLCETESRGV